MIKNTIKVMQDVTDLTAVLLGVPSDSIKGGSRAKKLVLGRFYKIEGIDPSTFSNLKKRSPKLQAAFKFAKMCIGITREEGMLLNKLNASGVIASMPMYSEEWKEHAEWKAIQQQKKTDTEKVKFVVLEKVPESSIVPTLTVEPVRKDEDE